VTDTGTGTFAELLATPGVAEDCVLRGRIGFMAYHGGSLEEMTDVIAAAAAERCAASYYAVRQPPDLNWHIPSHKVAAEDSPALAGFLDHVDVVITIHGFGRRGLFTALLLGGQNRALAEHVGGHLRARLPAYSILTELEAIPKELRGLHATNPVNVPRRQGVQIELPPRVRGSSMLWADWEGPGLTPHTEALIDGLVAAASSWELDNQGLSVDN
jgi:phage replication-related protein YjqB (UPF0714/DUF867 family)